ncbi:alginate O-acetyltransferase AlgX-related protein [Hymenobacter norwichensis]|uniref:alginate O-acetyltransferase AlgX-related protein n=1 Tax=Hymenobacter norwichensis TaxID=223903 RepID=UPI00146A510D|nr:hypothetical protein [Hymenobacter norwichensis]
MFAFLFLLLALPSIQAKFHLLKEEQLAGAYIQAEHPDFSLDALLDGSYQPKLEQYLEDRIGLRTWLISLRNQLSFSLWRVARSTDLVIGRNDVLFQPRVIDAYLGAEYLGDDEVRHRIRRLRIVQDDLTQRGIGFLFVMAPNKARFQPEDLPFTVARPVAGRSNYEAMVQEMKTQDINLLDCSAFFVAAKDTSRYPLFPKGGTHWSGYGITLAADTIFRRIEQIGNFNLRDFHRQPPLEVLQGGVKMTDSDLSDPLNLIIPYTPYPRMAYPQIVFDSLRADQQQPNLLLYGDSFNWGLMHFYPYFQTLFSPVSRFRSLNGVISPYTESGEPPVPMDISQQMAERNFVLILKTEHNLMYGEFIDQLYELYHPLTEADNVRVKALEQELLRSPGVNDSLWAQAYRNNVPFEDLLHNKARGLYDRTERKP